RDALPIARASASCAPRSRPRPCAWRPEPGRCPPRGTSPGRVPGWTGQRRFHRWLAPPLQVQMLSATPLAVAFSGTSRHLPAPTAVMLPSWLKRHFWLSWPLQSQMITLVPSAVPLLFTSRHLLPSARRSPAAVAVHCWLLCPWQSQVCTGAPLAWDTPATSRHRPDPTPWMRLAGIGVPPLTRKTTVPWGGTLAEMAPLVEVTASVQASRRLKELPDRPIAEAVVLIVVVLPPWLNRATATSPPLSRLARTRRVPSLLTWTAWSPSGSWLMSIRFRFFMIVAVAEFMFRMSLP